MRDMKVNMNTVITPLVFQLVRILVRILFPLSVNAGIAELFAKKHNSTVIFLSRGKLTWNMKHKRTIKDKRASDWIQPHLWCIFLHCCSWRNDEAWTRRVFGQLTNAFKAIMRHVETLVNYLTNLHVLTLIRWDTEPKKQKSEGSGWQCVQCSLAMLWTSIYTVNIGCPEY